MLHLYFSHLGGSVACSEVTKAKISQSMMGHKVTDKTKDKQRQSWSEVDESGSRVRKGVSFTHTQRPKKRLVWLSCL